MQTETAIVVLREIVSSDQSLFAAVSMCMQFDVVPTVNCGAVCDVAQHHDGLQAAYATLGCKLSTCLSDPAAVIAAFASSTSLCAAWF